MHDRIYTHISANYSALIPFCNEVLTMWRALFQTSNTLTTTENNNRGNKHQLHNMTWSQSQTGDQLKIDKNENNNIKN